MTSKLWTYKTSALRQATSISGHATLRRSHDTCLRLYDMLRRSHDTLHRSHDTLRYVDLTTRAFVFTTCYMYVDLTTRDVFLTTHVTYMYMYDSKFVLLQPGMYQQPRPTSYLGCSIFVCLCCNCLIGIIAIIFSCECQQYM